MPDGAIVCFLIPGPHGTPRKPIWVRTIKVVK